MFFLQLFILLAWIYTELHLQYGTVCPSSLRSFEQGGWLLTDFFDISTTSFQISTCQPITQHAGAHREGGNFPGGSGLSARWKGEYKGQGTNAVGNVEEKIHNSVWGKTCSASVFTELTS